jgi:hypothetical protein
MHLRNALKLFDLPFLDALRAISDDSMWFQWRNVSEYLAQDFRWHAVEQGIQASTPVVMGLEHRSSGLSSLENGLESANLLVKSCQLGRRRGQDRAQARSLGGHTI